MHSKVASAVAASQPIRRKLIGTPKEKVLIQMKVNRSDYCNDCRASAPEIRSSILAYQRSPDAGF
jgi:hypothetical protein